MESSKESISSLPKTFYQGHHKMSVTNKSMKDWMNLDRLRRENGNNKIKNANQGSNGQCERWLKIGNQIKALF
jgi:hypothetical protein